LFDNLDARRANLKNKVGATLNNNNNNNKNTKAPAGVQQRRNETAKSQKDKRAEKIAAKRGGAGAAAPAAGGGGKAKQAEKPKKEVAKSAQDLDSEMAAYWFKAGKGENPVKASLDNDLASYFKKNAEAAPAPAATAAAAEE